MICCGSCCSIIAVSEVLWLDGLEDCCSRKRSLRTFSLVSSLSFHHQITANQLLVRPSISAGFPWSKIGYVEPFMYLYCLAEQHISDKCVFTNNKSTLVSGGMHPMIWNDKYVHLKAVNLRRSPVTWSDSLMSSSNTTVSGENFAMTRALSFEVRGQVFWYM